ncbi:MAG: carboxypeptidase regulatory-like domain-containing protein [Isosphaeraceae bacterium]
MVLFASLICVAMAQGQAAPLSGTVAGPDGTPVAGAELILAGLPVYDPPILARGRSDASGRFRLDRPAGLAGQDRYIAPMLWVVKPGFRLSCTKFPGPMPGADEPVRVVLRPPGKAEVRVDGPGGEPLAGARVRVERFGRESTNVPDDVADLIEAITDRNGLAVIWAADNDEVAYIDVRTTAFGIQGRPFFPTSTQPKRVWLRPASSLKGQLTAEDRAMVKGWRVSAYTRTGDPTSREPATNGFATGTTDEEGRFAFPAIAPGGLQLELKPPSELPVLPQLPASLVVIEGGENAIAILLRKPATITGVIKERGTGRPVPGAELYLIPLRRAGKTLSARTDAEGRYTFPSLPGEVRISLFRMPPTYVAMPGVQWKDFTVAEGAGRIEMEPREAIPAAPPLRIAVRDEAGKPVSRASISAEWTAHRTTQATDDRGETELSGIAPGDEVTIEAHRHDRATDEPVKAHAGDTKPVVVTIVPGLTLAAVGRVLGPGGTPVVGASVKVKARKNQPNGRFSFPQPIQFDDSLEIRTGPDGTFRVPKELDKRAKDFQVEVTADGFLSRQSEWVPSSEGDRIAFPDVSLRRSPTFRFVSGRVVDREGKGVAGASVFQSGDGPRRTSATTDAQGGFRLAGMPNGDALVFAEKAGFRFGGSIVKPGDTRIDVRLARVAEPPLSMPKSLPSPLGRAEERAMARELLAPLIDAARAGSLGYASDSVIPALARVDPDRVLAMVENRVLSGVSSVLERIAVAQFESDPAAALATIEADSDPAVRAPGFLAIADATPDSDRAHRTELIDRTLAEARKVENPEFKLQLLGRIADRWLELDAPDRAIPVIREGQAIAAAMPRDRFSLGLEEFGEVLAVIDLPAARVLFERKGMTNVSPADAATINRHLGEAAVRLASINPSEAERLVPAVVPNFWDGLRQEYVLRICRRMARADLPRTRKILETIDAPTGPASYASPTLLPYGLGLMASELSETRPDEARALLEEAFTRLRAVAAAQGVREVSPPVSCVMAELLPTVERLEPGRLEERLWLGASCRASLAEQPDMTAIQPRVILAMLVSRYDRAMAAAILAPALERLPDLLTDPSRGNYSMNAPPVAALAACDPRAAVALLRALPDSARKAPAKKDDWNAASVDAQVRLAIAQTLGLPVEERRRKAIGFGYNPWPARWGLRPISN